MDANTLVERVARAMREAPMRATMAQPDRVIDPDIPVTEGDMLRARAALREIVAAAGGVDALEWSAAKVRKDEPATAALLRALAEGGKDA